MVLHFFSPVYQSHISLLYINSKMSFCLYVHKVSTGTVIYWLVFHSVCSKIHLLCLHRFRRFVRLLRNPVERGPMSIVDGVSALVVGRINASSGCSRLLRVMMTVMVSISRLIVTQRSPKQSA